MTFKQTVQFALLILMVAERSGGKIEGELDSAMSLYVE